MIQVTLDAYLDRLRSEEGYKRESEQRPVPSYGELAEEAGIAPVTLSRIANGHIKQLSLDTASSILDALNRRGFPADISDLLTYYPPREE